MRVHLIDGTYELFRQHFGSAAHHSESVPYAATIGVVASTLQLVSDGATHIGVASDHPGCLVEKAVNRAMDDAFQQAEALLIARLGQVTLADLARDFDAGFQNPQCDIALAGGIATGNEQPEVPTTG